jgi:hypothetical protein
MRVGWGRWRTGDNAPGDAVGCLPPRTQDEVSRELRMRSMTLLWKAQHLRAKSERLLARSQEHHMWAEGFFEV